MVRDFTTAIPKAKSEVRRRIEAALSHASKLAREEERDNCAKIAKAIHEQIRQAAITAKDLGATEETLRSYERQLDVAYAIWNSLTPHPSPLTPHP